MSDQKKQKLKTESTLRFLDAAQELLETESYSDISIRKIADLTGMHNSTIYLYFKDIDELLAIASLKYFSDYNKGLAEIGRRHLSPTDDFLYVWKLFMIEALKRVDLFYHFFYGKYRDHLTYIINRYYSLYPDTEALNSSTLNLMYFGNNMRERSMKLMEPIINNPATKVTPQNADTVNWIIDSCCKTILEQKFHNPFADSQTLLNKFLDVITFTTGLTITE